MHCTHCFSLMITMEQQREGRTEQTRFECPTCGRNHLSTRQVSVMSLQRESVERATKGDRYWREKFG
jgi:DNA-directed RNA polymerase subunit M/transcription elongation factor TFIIS